MVSHRSHSLIPYESHQSVPEVVQRRTVVDCRASATCGTPVIPPVTGQDSFQPSRLMGTFSRY